jgi:hypothetical protein
MHTTFLKFFLPPNKGSAFQPKRSQLDLRLFLFDLLYTAVNFDLFDPIINLICISSPLNMGKLNFTSSFNNVFLEVLG